MAAVVLYNPCLLYTLTFTASSLSYPPPSSSLSPFPLSTHAQITNHEAVASTREFGFAFVCGLTFLLLLTRLLHHLPCTQGVLRYVDN